MIKVTVYNDGQDNIRGFSVEGHAGFARRGKDIVCAAVSSLVLNTINSIEQFTDDEFTGVQDEKNAKIDFTLKEGCGPDSQLLLKSLVLGLESIEQDNRKYLSITFQEV